MKVEMNMNMFMRMDIETFRNLVGTKIFSVEFVKKNGDIRKLVGRLGVKKYVKNTKPQTIRQNSLSRNNQIIVYEMKGVGGPDNYRTVNLNSLINLRVNHLEISI